MIEAIIKHRWSTIKKGSEKKNSLCKKLFIGVGDKEFIATITISELPREKKCTRCEKIKAISNFSRSLKGKHGLWSYCKECDKNRKVKRQKETWQLIPNHYGNKCAVCGIDFGIGAQQATIDHIDGRVSEGKKKLRGYELRVWIIKNEFPDGYRLVCKSCNSIEGNTRRFGNINSKILAKSQKEVLCQGQ